MLKNQISKAMKKLLFLFISILIFAPNVFCKITLPALFSDNMVLQQQSQVRIWGTAKPSSKVHIATTWDEETYVTNSDNSGNWSLEITTPKAGGPYDISIDDGERIMLRNVLIGEVWVCSGQSNMEMPLRGNSSPILNANEIILNADNPSLRLFNVKRATSSSPNSNCKGEWNESNSETAREFSAMAYQFGEILQKKLNVPVGLILSSVGGTMIQSWMSNDALSQFKEVEIPSNLEDLKSPHKEPTALFNGMIAPLTHIPIKGVIWCQGESNRHEPELYGDLFLAMVADWREKWGLGNFPFYYVQIAPYYSSDSTRSGVLVREAQLNAMKKIPNSGMASAIDVGMENDIHYMNKTIPAQRLAYWALAKTYDVKGIGYQGPIYSSMEIEDYKIILSFDNARYLTSYQKPLELFEIAGEDKVFYPAEASIDRGKVIVSSSNVPHPIAVRYAFKEWIKGELYNNDGLPASSFRTDNW